MSASRKCLNFITAPWPTHHAHFHTPISHFLYQPASSQIACDIFTTIFRICTSQSSSIDFVLAPMSTAQSPDPFSQRTNPQPYFPQMNVPRTQPVQMVVPDNPLPDHGFPSNQYYPSQQAERPLPQVHQQQTYLAQQHDHSMPPQQKDGFSGKSIPVPLLQRWPATVDCPACGRRALTQ